MSTAPVSTVTLPIAAPVAAAESAQATVETPVKPVKVRPDLGFKADGTPRLRRPRGSGPARRSAAPRPVVNFFTVDGKSGVVTPFNNEYDVLEYLGSVEDPKNFTIIRGQRLAMTTKVVLAELK